MRRSNENHFRCRQDWHVQDEQATWRVCHTSSHLCQRGDRYSPSCNSAICMMSPLLDDNSVFRDITGIMLQPAFIFNAFSPYTLNLSHNRSYRPFTFFFRPLSITYMFGAIVSQHRCFTAQNVFSSYQVLHVSVLL